MRFPANKSWHSWASLVGVLAIALVLLSGMVQAAHFHPNGQVDHDCALCMSAHSVAQMAPPVTLQLSNVPITHLHPARGTARPRLTRFFVFVTRPPPAASAWFA